MLWCWVFGRVYGGAVAWVPFWETEITWLCCTQVPPSLLNRTDKHYIKCQQVASGHFGWMKLHVGDQNEGIFFSSIVGLFPHLFPFIFCLTHHVWEVNFNLNFHFITVLKPWPVQSPWLQPHSTPSRKGHKAKEGEELYLPFHPHSSFPSYSLLL